jgi:hypothetical protein
MNQSLLLPCQFEDCSQMAVAYPAFCYGCDKILCRQHLDTPTHQDGCRTISVSDELHFEGMYCMANL